MVLDDDNWAVIEEGTADDIDVLGNILDSLFINFEDNIEWGGEDYDHSAGPMDV